MFFGQIRTTNRDQRLNKKYGTLEKIRMQLKDKALRISLSVQWNVPQHSEIKSAAAK